MIRKGAVPLFLQRAPEKGVRLLFGLDDDDLDEDEDEDDDLDDGEDDGEDEEEDEEEPETWQVRRPSGVPLKYGSGLTSGIEPA